VNLIEELAAPPAKRPKGKSLIDEWLETRPEPEQQAILVAATNPQWGHIALRDTLADAGCPKLSDTAFRMWRMNKGYQA
jgi:hypothetical protein